MAARSIAQRAGLGKNKALAVNTLWLQEVVRESGLPIKSIASKGNKADLGLKVLPVARLNMLRGACGIVVPGELSKNTVEGETELDLDWFFWNVMTTKYRSGTCMEPCVSWLCVNVVARSWLSGRCCERFEFVTVSVEIQSEELL